MHFTDHGERELKGLPGNWRMFALLHLVCCLRDHNRVFESHWTKRRGSEVMDYN
jgi:hypothetical protein